MLAGNDWLEEELPPIYEATDSVSSTAGEAFLQAWRSKLLHATCTFTGTEYAEFPAYDKEFYARLPEYLAAKDDDEHAITEAAIDATFATSYELYLWLADIALRDVLLKPFAKHRSLLWSLLLKLAQAKDLDLVARLPIFHEVFSRYVPTAGVQHTHKDIVLTLFHSSKDAKALQQLASIPNIYRYFPLETLYQLRKLLTPLMTLGDTHPLITSIRRRRIGQKKKKEKRLQQKPKIFRYKRCIRLSSFGVGKRQCANVVKYSA